MSPFGKQTDGWRTNAILSHCTRIDDGNVRVKEKNVNLL